MKERNAGKSWGITTLTAVALVLVGWFGRELMPTVAVAKVGKRARRMPFCGLTRSRN